MTHHAHECTLPPSACPVPCCSAARMRFFNEAGPAATALRAKKAEADRLKRRRQGGTGGSRAPPAPPLMQDSMGQGVASTGLLGCVRTCFEDMLMARQVSCQPQIKT